MGAQVKRIIRGTTTLASGSSPDLRTISLPTDLDPTKTILQFTTRCSGNDPKINNVSGRIQGSLGSAQLRFRRGSYLASKIPTIDYEVIEFASGVSVQRGTASSSAFTDTGADFTRDVTITSVDTTKSFPLVTNSGDSDQYTADDFVKAQLTSSTNLRLSMDDSDTAHADTDNLEWQVISFSDATSVQAITGTLAADDDSMTAACSAVTLARSLILLSYTIEGNSDIPASQAFLTAKFNSTTQIQIDRVTSTGSPVARWVAYVIQFDTDVTVLSGSDQIGSGLTLATVTHADTPLESSALFLAGSNHTSGRTTNTAADAEGDYANVNLNSRTTTDFVAQRSANGAFTTNFEWFLVEWPLHTGARLGPSSGVMIGAGPML